VGRGRPGEKRRVGCYVRRRGLPNDAEFWPVPPFPHGPPGLGRGRDPFSGSQMGP
jgi:hypothetical protein